MIGTFDNENGISRDRRFDELPFWDNIEGWIQDLYVEILIYYSHHVLRTLSVCSDSALG
jgi:hypothetical protein